MGGRKGPPFTGAEDEALRALVQNVSRIKWKEITKSLVALGYAHRSKSSLRNRFLRSQRAKTERDTSKNRCRLCGQFQKGHVCSATMTPPVPQKAVVVEEDTARKAKKTCSKDPLKIAQKRLEAEIEVRQAKLAALKANAPDDKRPTAETTTHKLEGSTIVAATES